MPQRAGRHRSSSRARLPAAPPGSSDAAPCPGKDGNVALDPHPTPSRLQVHGRVGHALHGDGGVRHHAGSACDAHDDINIDNDGNALPDVTYRVYVRTDDRRGTATFLDNNRPVTSLYDVTGGGPPTTC